MHISKASLSSLALAIFYAYVEATYLNNDLSFGHNNKISPNLRAIPNFHIMGKPNVPEILSNKIVLTPPAPGNQRGAIWSEKVLQHSQWTVDVDFRATGPERGGGNLQIWYARNGKEDVGTSSIYTVGRWEGLALVVDQYAGSAGFIRGFLNDGSTDYAMHQSVDSIAFGHCSYSYRNLGRPSRIAITQTADTFRVNIDGNICFESDKVKIPLGYNFGISAASAENPDTFEVFKLVTTTESHTPDVVDLNTEQQQRDQQRWMANSDPKSPNYNIQKSREPPQPNNPGTGDIPSFSSDPPEVPAASIQNSNEQFADLHNRLQAMMKHISALNRDFMIFQTNSATRHAELIKTISTLEAAFNRLNDINAKMGEIQADVRQTKQDLHNSLDRHISGLKHEVRSGHSTVMGTIAGLGTGVGKFVLVVVGSQALTVGAYLLYKRRKANSPKKYL